MSDPFGLNEGVKSLTGSLDASRESAKSLSKQVEAIQKDAVDVAQQQAKARRTAQREAEFKKQQAIFKALDEYKRRKLLTDQEVELKKQFIKQYGSKEWDSVLRIKTEIEALEKHNIKEFQHDLKSVRRVQFWCFFVAAFIAWYLTWGIK
jgi:LAS superfamily LD-carboxypeptidase LdcB